MQFGEGSEGIEGRMADGVEISGEEAALEIGGKGLDEDSGKRFSFLVGESDPGSIEVGVGVSVEVVKQIGNSKVDQGLLIACLIKRWGFGSGKVRTAKRDMVAMQFT